MLRLEGLYKTFNKGTINQKRALSNLSLTLQEGDFVTVIGSNGAGKSTMLNAIAGVFLIDKGKIYINNNDVTSLPEHKRAGYIGRVFQDPMLGTCAGMQIGENLSMASRRGLRNTLRWSSKSKDTEVFREKLRSLDLGLEQRMTTRVGLLSGGQRQALTLLMATLRRPDLLLLDEHTAALDPKTAAKVLSITDRLVREEQLTTVMITHNMKEAIQYGNRLVMLHEGRVIADIDKKQTPDLSVTHLMTLFEQAGGAEALSGEMIFS